MHCIVSLPSCSFMLAGYAADGYQSNYGQHAAYQSQYQSQGAYSAPQAQFQQPVAAAPLQSKSSKPIQPVCSWWGRRLWRRVREATTRPTAQLAMGQRQLWSQYRAGSQQTSPDRSGELPASASGWLSVLSRPSFLCPIWRPHRFWRLLPCCFAWAVQQVIISQLDPHRSCSCPLQDVISSHQHE